MCWHVRSERWRHVLAWCTQSAGAKRSNWCQHRHVPGYGHRSRGVFVAIPMQMGCSGLVFGILLVLCHWCFLVFSVTSYLQKCRHCLDYAPKWNIITCLNIGNTSLIEKRDILCCACELPALWGRFLAWICRCLDIRAFEHLHQSRC